MATAVLNTVTKETSKDEVEIKALIAGIHKAHYDKDTAAIAAPFTSDAAIFDLSPPLMHRGINVAEKKAWLDTWDGPIEYDSHDLNITVSGDSAYCHGYFRLAGTTKMAGQRVDFWMRATVCLARVDGVWKIVHKHTSVPFYMDGSLRPAFDLVPDSIQVDC
jgi:ketosteroid isomerase-like protein